MRLVRREPHVFALTPGVVGGGAQHGRKPVGELIVLSWNGVHKNGWKNSWKMLKVMNIISTSTRPSLENVFNSPSLRMFYFIFQKTFFCLYFVYLLRSFSFSYVTIHFNRSVEMTFNWAPTKFISDAGSGNWDLNVFNGFSLGLGFRNYNF